MDKQQTAVEQLIEHLNQKFPTQMRSIYQQNQYLLEHVISVVKGIEKNQQNEFSIDFVNWLNNNEYKYNHKFKMYQKHFVNETLYFTLAELILEFNKLTQTTHEKTIK
jgi:hypothetical protein